MAAIDTLKKGNKMTNFDRFLIGLWRLISGSQAPHRFQA
jgi:hypothetical protein